MVYALFFLSGSSALLYEIAWLNRIQLIMGHTIYALATVLGAYLMGIAWGAYSSGRMLEGKKCGLTLYLIFELIVGVYGILFYPLLKLAHFIYAPLATNFSWSLSSLSLIQFFFCGLIIFIPTFLMGATLPLLSDFLFKQSDQISKKISGLYAVNSFGALFGCLMGGLVILPSLGYQNTIYLAASINLILFCMAISFRGKIQLPNWADWKQIMGTVIPRFTGPGLDKVDKSLLIILFSSGSISLLSQLLWNRLAQLSFGPSTYVFPIITSVVLLGITLGSVGVNKFFKQIESKNSILGVCLIFGLSTFCWGNYFFGRTPLIILQFLNSWEPKTFSFYFFQWSWSVLCLLPASLFIGALFPLAMSLFVQNQNRASSGVGIAFCVNIMGVLAGSLIGSFVIMPYFGLNSVGNLAIFMFGTALGLYLLWIKKVTIGILAAPILTVLFIVLVPKFDYVLLTSGYFYNRTKIPDKKEFESNYLDFQSYHQWTRSKLIDYKDDVHGTISIHESWGKKNPSKWFKINGKVDGNTKVDAHTVRLIGLLPLLFKTDFKDVLTIGLGVGDTADSTRSYPELNSSTIIELSPSVIHFAQKYFKENSGNIWKDKRFKVINRDGREYLLHNKKKYDLILSEPSNPWVDGVGSLFTQEYFQLMIDSLKPGGMGVAWFHVYGLSCDAIESVFMAAYKTFPHIMAFEVQKDLFILFSKDEPLIFKNHINNLSGPREEISRLLSEDEDKKLPAPPTFMKKIKRSIWLKNRDKLGQYNNYPIVNTDDNQYLQFSAGKSYFQKMSCYKHF